VRALERKSEPAASAGSFRTESVVVAGTDAPTQLVLSPNVNGKRGAAEGGPMIAVRRSDCLNAGGDDRHGDLRVVGSGSIARRLAPAGARAT
jgi:hypothetical protein